MTKIKCKKTLYNHGQCFTKGSEYIVTYNVKDEPGLMDARVINDRGQWHTIGSWWRHFAIIGYTDRPE